MDAGVGVKAEGGCAAEAEMRARVSLQTCAETLPTEPPPGTPQTRANVTGRQGDNGAKEGGSSSSDEEENTRALKVRIKKYPVLVPS